MKADSGSQLIHDINKDLEDLIKVTVGGTNRSGKASSSGLVKLVSRRMTQLSKGREDTEDFIYLDNFLIKSQTSFREY